MVGEGVQVLCGGNRGKFSKLGARSGPRTRSAHLIPSRSDVLHFFDNCFPKNDLSPVTCQICDNDIVNDVRVCALTQTNL